MAEDGAQRASLAYRNARAAIWAGRIPPKYVRVFAQVPGSPILELGAAEGVLSLMLASKGAEVTGLELRRERYEEALQLKAHWLAGGHEVGRCNFVCGDIRENLGLFSGVQTVVAVRMAYYLREDAGPVFEAARNCGVQAVVLVGNGNRAAQSAADPGSDLGRFNRLATVAGMTELLEGAGFEAAVVDPSGDPIVLGTATGALH